MEKADFVVVGSSGGGGTIAWLLAKAGYSVVVLEQGTDWAAALREPVEDAPVDEERRPYNPVSHDEYRFRLERPELKRHPRGDYNTFRETPQAQARPFGAGWTGSMLGGGSVIWGAWCFRGLPVDYQLATLFGKTTIAGKTTQLDQLQQWGYSVPDWPVTYREMSPYYNIAESLLSVCGDREAVHQSILKSRWYEPLRALMTFNQADWHVQFPFPSPPFPTTPVGYAVELGMQRAKCTAAPLPSGMVSPGSAGYATREHIARALRQWKSKDRPAFWNKSEDEIWSERIRDACNLCGYCGEYLCWGKRGPKSGARASTIEELRDLPNVEIVTNARAYEVVYDQRIRRASGVRYLDTTVPDHPVRRLQSGRFVIVAGGAVQSARLLFLSGPASGLGNRFDQLGRYATFHLFGLGASVTLPPRFQGKLHGELGHTGNTTTFEHYFMSDKPGDPNGRWWKGGTVVSTAKKNPLDNATSLVGGKPPLMGRDLLTGMENFTRSYEVRLTGDDLPRAANRVDLDPHFVDEYGFPVARITRSFGPAETQLFELAKPAISEMFAPFVDPKTVVVKPGNITLIGDHQMGTCRMGDDATESVVDRFCRLHDAPNVFVIDTSFMPTGMGLNPMVTVVANALRVGSWIVQEGVRGSDLESDSETPPKRRRA